MTEPGLTTARDGAVLTVTLDRPARLNALDDGLIAALTDCFARLAEREDIRVVVLRANGRHFCAGVDLGAPDVAPDRPDIARALRLQKRIANIIRLMRACPQPIVALGHGAATGGGFSLLLAADVRFGSPSLRMNAAYARIGLGGCDIGSSYFLPRLIGASIAAELLLTGRFLDADRALRLGLLSDVVAEEALLPTGIALAHEMLEVAPMGLRLTKEALNINIDAPGLDAAIALEDRQQVMLAATGDHGEAVRAFLAKRPARFTGA